MNKESQANFYEKYIVGFFALVFTIMLIVNLIIANIFDVPNSKLRWQILGGSLVVFLILQGLGKLFFKHRKLIEKAMKPGVSEEKRLELLKESIRIEPTVEAYKKLAEQKMLKYGEANQIDGIGYCDKILQIDSNDYEAYIMKSHFYAELNQNEDAVKWITKSIEMNPDHKKTSNYSRYKVRGTWHLDNGNYEEAKADLVKSIEQKEPNKNVLFYLGLAEEKLGNEEFALLNYRQHLDKKAGYRGVDARAQIRSANIYLERGDMLKAQEYWNEFTSDWHTFSKFDSAEEENEMIDRLKRSLKTG